MFAPDFFETTGTASNGDRLMGALDVTCSLIAVAEVGRSLRFLNICLALGCSSRLGPRWIRAGRTVERCGRWPRIDSSKHFGWPDS